MYGMMQEPPIMLEIPDLVDVNDAGSKPESRPKLSCSIRFFLNGCFRNPRSHVRHFTYWSYIEGIRAEELSRMNWIAEKAVLQAEGLNAVAFALRYYRPTESSEPI